MTSGAPEAPFYPDEAHEDLRRRYMRADRRLASQQLSSDDALMLIVGLAEVADTLAAAIPAAESTHGALMQATADEVAARKAAVDDLLTRIMASADRLAAEVSRAVMAEAGLRTDLNTETLRAKAAEGVNTSAINTEASTARAAEQANAKAVADEATRAKTAETAEVTARANADTALGVRVDAEVTARASGDTAATRSALWFPPYAAGNSHGPAGTAEVYSLTHERLQLVPLFVPPGSAPIKAMQFEVTSAATSGRLARVGIWQDNGTGQPSTLLADAGTATPTVVGLLKYTFSTPLNATGWVWLGIAQQGSTSGNNAQIRGVKHINHGVRQSPVGTVGMGLAGTASAAFAANPNVTLDTAPVSPRLTLLF